MTILVDDCCGIIKLRNGCFIIGYLNLASTMYLMFYCAFGIARGDIMTRENPSHNTASTIGMALVIMYSIILVPTLFELLFTILLLVGLHKKIRCPVKAYLIFKIVFLVIYIVTFIAYLGGGNITFKVLMSSLCVLCLSAYYFLVIRSYFIKMKNDTKPDDAECESS